MMKNVIIFIKHNIKYIIPLLILIVVIVVCILNINIYKPNQEVTIDNFNALNYKDYSGSLTINGETDGFKYQWFYSQNMLTDCQTTDLNLIFTSEYDDIIEDSLKSSYYCAYYFPENLQLNGYPTLTVYISDEEPLQDFKLYKFNPTDNIFTEVSIAYNLTDDGHSITYAVKDINCVYVITANEENQTTVTIEQTTTTENIILETSETTTITLDTTKSTLQTTTNTTKSQTTSESIEESQSQSTSISSDIVNDNVISNENVPPKRELSNGSQVTQDDYLTDPIPEGQPLPVEPEDVTITYDDYYTCYLTIRCDTILDNMENLTSGKEEYVPENGIIYDCQEIIFYEGESVYDVLARETEKNGIQMECSFTPMYNSVYIEGINNLYEFDCGSLSGWVYSVNDWFPNYGCSRYMLSQGDNIVFYYTCDLGQDVGCILGDVS